MSCPYREPTVRLIHTLRPVAKVSLLLFEKGRARIAACRIFGTICRRIVTKSNEVVERAFKRKVHLYMFLCAIGAPSPPMILRHRTFRAPLQPSARRTVRCKSSPATRCSARAYCRRRPQSCTMLHVARHTTHVTRHTSLEVHDQLATSPIHQLASYSPLPFANNVAQLQPLQCQSTHTCVHI
jgi:hypothetical protein